MSGPLNAVDAIGNITPLRVDASGNLKVSGGGGGGGSSGDVTAPGVTGTLAQAVQGITGGVPLRVNQAGITFVNSTLNTTSAELASGASFVGTWEDAFNQPAAQILANSNQAMVYTFEQAVDAAGAYVISSTKFRRGANEDLCENVQINGNYVRVSAQNIGYSSTTLFELNTTYGPLDVAPTALSNSGNFPVAAREAQNITRKLRDHYQTFPTENTTRVVKAAGDILVADGNAAGASYLVMSLDPLTAGTETFVSTDAIYTLPLELGFGVHASNRTYGQELSASLISDQFSAAPAELAISSIQQATTVLTVNTATAHGLKIGDRIGIYGVTQDSRLNLAALVVATTPSLTQFTVTSGPQGAITSLTVGPFTSGFVYKRDALSGSTNGTSVVFENASSTNGSFYVKAEGGDAMPVGGTLAGNHSASVSSTSSVVAAQGAFNYAFRPSSQYNLLAMADRLQWADRGVDSIGQTTNRANVDQVCPDPDQFYAVRYSVKNRKGLTVPVAKVVSAAKSGTTTATVVTDVAHGLTTGDYINVFGVRDQANFANLSTGTIVASVVNSTTFTVVWGSAVTATSYGGYVSRVQGSITQQGVVPQVVSTAARTANVVTLVGNAAWTVLSIGDYVNVHGCSVDGTGADLGIDGVYRVRDQQTTSLILEAIPTTNAHASNPVTPSGANITTTNCGGSIIKRTDLRVSFTRLFDYERLRVEPLPRPGSDQASAFPVVVNAGSLAISSGTVTTVSTVTNGNVGFPGMVSDVTSAAITSSSTTSAFTPSYGCSYEICIPVTAVSGTSPTLDVSVEESDDGGTNWFKVFDFPRITASGMYRSPKLALVGNRVRHVQTVGGTSPSFTRAVNRNQCSDAVTDPVRQLIDRSVSLTTLNSATPSINTQNGRNKQLMINLGAATTPPALQMQCSDDNGATWYVIGSPLTGVASSTVSVTVNNINAQLTRAIVTTAGATVTAGYVLVKSF